MSTVDLTQLDRQVAAAARLLNGLRPHLADVHAIAYERAVGGDRVGGRSHVEGYAHTTTGDPRAKDALRRLEHALLEVVRATTACTNLLADGDVDHTLRGTMLGDATTGHHAAAELERLKAAQSRRRDRGEHVPARLEEQPGLAKPKTKKKRGKR